MVVNLGHGEVPLGGDIILAVDGVKADPANLQKIRDILTTKPSGSPYKVTVLRAGKVIDLTGRTP
jgi:S1-C subfamily serine protease